MNPVTAYGLTPEKVAALGRELDALRAEQLATRGARDRNYLLRLLRVQRACDIGGRLLAIGSLLLLPAGAGLPFALCFGAGVAVMALAKILENMEIAHNVLHGQWDWMRDPEIQASTWEWDLVCPSRQWIHTHNVVHHTWTNVLGKDRDIGYAMLRVTSAQRWHPFYLLQPLNALLMALYFEWFIAFHDLEINRVVAGKRPWREVRPLLAEIGAKAWRQVRKDYLAWPLLGVAVLAPFWLAGAGPSPGAAFAWLLGAGIVANLLRNVWTFVIIFCGHFPEGVHHFAREHVERETRGGWYVRQLLGSCNIRGGRLFHILTGNLSHQIEHHLFPDLCSNRYPEIAPRVREIVERYGLPYNSGSLARQFGTTCGKIVRFAFPGPAAARDPLQPAH